MSAWTRKELDSIGAAGEVELTTLRSNGTPRKPVTVCVVRNGDDLYIRSWRGQSAAWFRCAQAHYDGQVHAVGIEKDIRFVNTDRSIDDQIDAAYRTRYTPVAPSYVEPMVSRQARATTLQLVSRS